MINQPKYQMTEMDINLNKVKKRDKLILIGLYFSKFNSDGLFKLDFTSYKEAFNIMGFALGAKPASIKNYRDEFDPIFPNMRKGWHNRPMRAYCYDIYKRYGKLDINDFSNLIKLLTYRNGELDLIGEEFPFQRKRIKSQSFAKRLLTGQAAERYFETVYRSIDVFSDCSILNTTMMGCGFDFKLIMESPSSFWGVEVKGLEGISGTISLTAKEHTVANRLKDRYFLFIVKNFRESPFWELYRNPIKSKLEFRKTEQVITQVTWSASV
ncbi:DUF3883 domain-containing protein [bacterium]|nr:DUF3883 domain-containing protein [bacterium]MBU1650731.1 DUF3883 domain-containing protein [bacterium]